MIHDFGRGLTPLSRENASASTDPVLTLELLRQNLIGSQPSRGQLLQEGQLLTPTGSKATRPI